MDVKGVFAQRNVWVMCVSMVLFGVSFGLWMPFFPLYVLKLGATPMDLGLVFVVFTLSRFVLQLPGGFLADRYGRRKVIVWASFARLPPPLIYYFAQTWEHVIIGMAINSIGSLYLPAFQAIIAESLPRGRRGFGFGLLWASFFSTEVFMPPIGGWILDSMGVVKGIRLTLMVSFIAVLGAVVLRVLFLKETSAADEPDPPQSMKDATGFLSELRGNLLVMLIFSCFTNFALEVAYPFLPVYATDILNLSKTQWGFLASAFGISSFLFQVPGGVLSDRMGRKSCITITGALTPLRPISLLFMRSYEGLLTIFVTCGIAEGINWPSRSALLADTTRHQTRGRIFGLFGAITGITSGPAPLIGGWAWGFISPSFPFILSAMCQFIGLMLFTALFRTPHRINNMLRDPSALGRCKNG